MELAADTGRLAFSLARIETFVLGVPTERPVVTSFGRMTERPALLIKVTGDDGAIGWGESWCNFPAVGARHRALLVETVVAPLVIGQAFVRPQSAFDALTAKTAILAIQSGEPGPLAQAIAGLDCAIWDMLARRAGLPLARFLSREARGRVPVYASGINPDTPEVVVLRERDKGHTRFKLKTGFGRDLDIRNLGEMRRAVGPDTTLMADANQAWDFDTAVTMSRALAASDPIWLEEPMPATTPVETWARLAAESPIPLALGENLRGAAAFGEAIAGAGIAFLQPDAGKWGGLSTCLPLAERTLAAGISYCPHWLGGAVGLMTSLHLLAAIGGPGMLEVDVNPNPLRDVLCPALPAVEAGTMAVPDQPGIGVEPDPDLLARYRVAV